MTIEVLIKNLDNNKETKEEVHVILEYKSLVKTVHTLHIVGGFDSFGACQI